MQNLIEFKNHNVKLIEFKPLINRLWHINEYNKNQFDIALKELDSAFNAFIPDKKSIIDNDLI